MPDVAQSRKRTGWTTISLGDVVDVINDYWDRDATIPERLVAGEHIDEGDMRIRRWGMTDDDLIPPTFNRRFRRSDGLLHSRNIAKVAQPDFDGVTGEKIFVLRSRDQAILVQDLVPYLVASDAFRQYAESRWAGSTNKFLNKTPLLQYEFALPPLEEQQRIVEALLAAERSRQSLEEVLDRSQAVLRSFLENELDPNRRGWRMALLGDLFDVKSGGTPSRGVKEYWNGSIPWVKTGEVRYETIHATEEAITEDGLKNSSAKLLPIGTVVVALFGQGPTLGRVGMLGIEAATNQACACVVPNDSQNSRFLYFYLQRQYERIRALARGANQPNLNLAIIKNLQVPLIGEEEQREWVERIEAVESAMMVVQQRVQGQRNLSGQIMQSALRGDA